MEHTAKLSEAEAAALSGLRHQGSILLSRIPDRTEKDSLGQIEPGMAVYRKLEKKGLVVICEPIVDDDGFEWTASVELP